MKKILIILITFLCVNLNAQLLEQNNSYSSNKIQEDNFRALTVEERNPYFPNPTHVLTANILSITLQAVGDGLRDKAWEYHNPKLSKWGHLANAGSVASLLVVPLGQGFDFYDWCWYVASYTLLRIAIFDPIYNMTRGLPWDYRGQSSNWDMLLNRTLKAPDGEFMIRVVAFSVGFSVPIQEWHIKNKRN
jgi:hypothetical protein